MKLSQFITYVKMSFLFFNVYKQKMPYIIKYALIFKCSKSEGKTSALKVLLGNTIHGLNTVLGEPDATHNDLKDTGTEFFVVLFGQKKAKTINKTRLQIYSRSKKPPHLEKLPPTDANLMLHILHAHLQVMLWKSAGQREPPVEARDIL